MYGPGDMYKEVGEVCWTFGERYLIYNYFNHSHVPLNEFISLTDE